MVVLIIQILLFLFLISIPKLVGALYKETPNVYEDIEEKDLEYYQTHNHEHCWVRPYPGMPEFCSLCLQDRSEKDFDIWFQQGFNTVNHKE